MDNVELREAFGVVTEHSIRAAFDAVADAFENIARESDDGDHATITYRDLIRILRNTGPHPEPLDKP